METLARFFALEGIDGAGTTTQADLLGRRLRSEEVDAWITAEPTTGIVGALIRRVLSGAVAVTPKTLAHLVVADRCEHLEAPETGIRAHLSEGRLVVTDRYLFSSLAYQSVECGFDYVRALNDGFPFPEAVVYLDVPTELALERSAGRTEREIYEHRRFQDAVRISYDRALRWAESAGVRVHRIDGTATTDAIHRQLWKIVTGLSIL